MKLFKKNKEYYEEIDEEKKINEINLKNTKENRIKRIINIIFAGLVIILVMITIDVVSISKYNKGPFFAIRTNIYNDGGTKVYYGLGYKVIKYHQTQGRRDTEIGLWTMKYMIEPTNYEALDLAIELRNKPKETYEKIGKKFLRITGTLDSISKSKNTITLKYNDPDEKYDLEIICSMAEKENNIETFTKEQGITIIGSVSDFKLKTKKDVNRLYVNNCFAE